MAVALIAHPTHNRIILKEGVLLVQTSHHQFRSLLLIVVPIKFRNLMAVASTVSQEHIQMRWKEYVCLKLMILNPQIKFQIVVWTKLYQMLIDVQLVQEDHTQTILEEHV